MSFAIPGSPPDGGGPIGDTYGAALVRIDDRSPVIDVPHLRAARALWDYAVRSVAHLFGTSTGDRHADALRTQLADGPLKWEDAKRALGVRSAAELEAAVALLESLGIAERAKTRVAGAKRPATVLRLAGTTARTTTTALAPALAEGSRTA